MRHKPPEAPRHRLFKDLRRFAWDGAFGGHDPGPGEQAKVVCGRARVQLPVDEGAQRTVLREHALRESLGRSRYEWVEIHDATERRHQPPVDVIGDAWLAVKEGHS